MREIAVAALESLLRWFSTQAQWVALAFLFLLLVQSLRLVWLRSEAGRRVSRHRKRGAGAEMAAARLLEASGYRIVERQPQGGYEMEVDQRLAKVRLRGDYLVTLGERRYLAEVKSGLESAKVSGRATRRQLLEYLFAFEVDGVLLVDMHAERIVPVSFPFLSD